MQTGKHYFRRAQENVCIHLTQILLFQIEKMSLTVEASKLLDFNQKLDIPLLDNVIGFMYNGIGEQVQLLAIFVVSLICMLAIVLTVNIKNCVQQIFLTM